MRRLVVLEPDVYQRLKEKQSTEKKIISDLDRQMQEILNSDISEEEKVRLYNQALQKSLFFEKKPSELKVNQPTTESTILKKFDRTKKPRAKKILEAIKENKSSGWDSQSRFVLDDQPVPGSNVIDLVSEAATKVTKKRKRRLLPGWNEFQSIWNST